MTQQQDFTAMMKDMMGSFSIDTSAMTEAFKTTASLNEKLAAAAIDAVEKSSDISGKWTKDTLTKLADMSKAKQEPSDYVKAMTDFTSAQAETASEHASAFAEVAKKLQMETVEIMMAAGKDISEDATAAVQKATNDATAAVKKAATDTTAVARKAAVAAK